MYARWAKRTKDALLRAAKQEEQRRLCPDCGIPLEQGMWLYRCEPCKLVRSKATKRKARRISKARRRATTRGAYAERFDPLEILARDGWRCHLCGCSTPKRLRGSYDDRAPELDHIVPIAAGGSHTRLNTACACRKCNITKGCQELGQLLLIA